MSWIDFNYFKNNKLQKNSKNIPLQSRDFVLRLHVANAAICLAKIDSMSQVGDCQIEESWSMVYHKMAKNDPQIAPGTGGMKLSPIRANFTLKDHVYDMLRDAITQMDIYAEGADLRLDERWLAEQLGISRTPLREAIARLDLALETSLPQRKHDYPRIF